MLVTGYCDCECFYPALHSIGRDTKFTVRFVIIHYVQLQLTDFPAGALSIGVKFCMAVGPHLRQVFYFEGISLRYG